MQEWEGRLNIDMSNYLITSINGSTRVKDKANRPTFHKVEALSFMLLFHHSIVPYHAIWFYGFSDFVFSLGL